MNKLDRLTLKVVGKSKRFMQVAVHYRHDTDQWEANYSLWDGIPGSGHGNLPESIISDTQEGIIAKLEQIAEAYMIPDPIVIIDDL